MRRPALIVLLLASPLCWTLYAQGQSFFSGVKVTGQLELKRTVNLALLAPGRAGRIFPADPFRSHRIFPLRLRFPLAPMLPSGPIRTRSYPSSVPSTRLPRVLEPRPPLQAGTL